MLFVTVGTTNFDELIRTVDQPEFHRHMKKIGFTRMILQIGEGQYVPQLVYSSAPETDLLDSVRYFRSSPDLSEYYDQAKLVVTHGGAGTVIECLRISKKLVIVPNREMHEHQMELAEYAHTNRYAIACTELRHLARQIQLCLETNSEPYPPPSVDQFLQDLKGILYSC